MTVPIYITIPSCLLVAVGVWFLGIRGTDITTPPTPAELAEVAEEWKASSPNIPPPKPIDPALFAGSEIVTPQNPATAPKQADKLLPVGDLDASPALSAYGTMGEEGVDAMIKLATHLETKGHFIHALLAWERVIDSTDPDEEQRALAVNAVKRLRFSLPPWNPDPGATIELTLHAGAAIKDKAALEDALQKTADVISEASGYVIHVTVKASIGKPSKIKTPNVPIAIWFSRPGKEAGAPSAATPPISFMTDPKQTTMLASQIQAGAYAMLRTHLASNTSFTPLPEFPPRVTPEALLKYHVTRLMWREFVKSLKE
ncbi:MAG: hypothetical protein ACPG32_05490 [Akkermansiaceae bacterium]